MGWAMGAIIGLILFIGFAIVLGSIGQGLLVGWGETLAAVAGRIEDDGISFLSAIAMLFLLIPVSFVIYNALVFFVALMAGVFGYAFDQSWGYGSIYEWFGGFFSPAYVRWMIGFHGAMWLGVLVIAKMDEKGRRKA
jgi:hypothetical protein